MLPVSAPVKAGGKGNPLQRRQSCHSSSSLLCFVFFQDDSPQIYPTSPGPVPITLAVDHVIVKRRDDGVFYLTGQQPQGTWFVLPQHPPARAGGSALHCLVLEETVTEMGWLLLGMVASGVRAVPSSVLCCPVTSIRMGRESSVFGTSTRILWLPCPLISRHRHSCLPSSCCFWCFVYPANIIPQAE